MMDRYRKPPGVKAYQVKKVEGTSAPWRVEFMVDGEDAGGGQYRTASEADEAGLRYMFSGWGEDPVLH